MRAEQTSTRPPRPPLWQPRTMRACRSALMTSSISLPMTRGVGESGVGPRANPLGEEGCPEVLGLRSGEPRGGESGTPRLTQRCDGALRRRAA